MAYRIHEAVGGSSDPPSDPLQEWVAKLCSSGSATVRQRALRFLVRHKAEQALVECLRHSTLRASQLAASGLWEIWFNECGKKARKKLELGIAFMNNEDFHNAESIFLEIMAEFPRWAEPINRQATLLFLRRQHSLSQALCRQVIRLKPHHFGAWSGLALCSFQLHEWSQAIDAARRTLNIVPHSAETKRLLQSILEESAAHGFIPPTNPPAVE